MQNAIICNIALLKSEHQNQLGHERHNLHHHCQRLRLHHPKIEKVEIKNSQLRISSRSSPIFSLPMSSLLLLRASETDHFKQTDSVMELLSQKGFQSFPGPDIHPWRDRRWHPIYDHSPTIHEMPHMCE